MWFDASPVSLHGWGCWIADRRAFTLFQQAKYPTSAVPQYCATAPKHAMTGIHTHAEEHSTDIVAVPDPERDALAALNL